MDEVRQEKKQVEAAENHLKPVVEEPDRHASDGNAVTTADDMPVTIRQATRDIEQSGASAESRPQDDPTVPLLVVNSDTVGKKEPICRPKRLMKKTAKSLTLYDDKHDD